MAQPPALALPKANPSVRDIGFALGIMVILCVLFLPIPPFLIDMGLAFSIALSVLILMVALWIKKPLEFSSFPTILLIATMTRLALNIATTRVILSHGYEGHDAAGGVIAGFASLVMSALFMRMQPWLTLRPTLPGSFVPWMPISPSPPRNSFSTSE